MSFTRFNSTASGGAAGGADDEWISDRMRNLEDGCVVASDGAPGTISTANSLNQMHLMVPITLVDTTVDAFVVECTTASAGSTMEMGLYDLDGSGSSHPNSLLENATVDTSTTGVKIAAFSEPRTLTGRFWLANLPQGTPGMRAWETCLPNSTYSCRFHDAVDQSLYADIVNIYRTSSGYSSMPDPDNTVFIYASTNQTRGIVALRGTRSDL